MYDKYVIEEGDTLKSIADKFNTLESTIMDINNISEPSLLRQGMEIIVPKESEKYFEYYTIKKGDNIYKIAREYNINPELLSALNGLEGDDFIYPEQRLLIPKSGYSYYITREGDTLDIVADRFNISKDKLLSHNDVIYLLPGQLLVNRLK